MEVFNLTPLRVTTVLALDRNAEETLAVVIKGTYDIKANQLRVSATQDPVRVADVYSGDPNRSSLLHAGERALHKTTTDVILVGSAYADRPDCRQVDVTMRVGPLTKTVRVFGDRVWLKTMGSTFASQPARFQRIPLVYERAFGGVDEGAGERLAANPVGVGFRGKKTKLPLTDTPLPNLEDPEHPIRSAGDRPAPRGCSFIAPWWDPRARFAGTYGPAWLENDAPLLPADYDERFQQVAPADQICPQFLRGGEKAAVLNGSASGRLNFTLPAPVLQVDLQISGESRPLATHLDTVVIDGDREIVAVTWRGHLSVHGRVHDVEAVRVAGERFE